MTLLALILLADNVFVICQPENTTYTNFNATNFTSGQIHAAQDFLLHNYVMERIINEVSSSENVVCYVATTPLDTLAFLPECVDSGSPSVREHVEKLTEEVKEGLKKKDL